MFSTIITTTGGLEGSPPSAARTNSCACAQATPSPAGSSGALFKIECPSDAEGGAGVAEGRHPLAHIDAGRVRRKRLRANGPALALPA